MTILPNTSELPDDFLYENAKAIEREMVNGKPACNRPVVGTNHCDKLHDGSCPNFHTEQDYYFWIRIWARSVLQGSSIDSVPEFYRGNVSEMLDSSKHRDSLEIDCEVRRLTESGHNCIRILETFPPRLRWCGKSVCEKN